MLVIILPFSLYETWIPKTLTRLCSHFSCNGLFLLFFHFPNQIAFVFFRFNFRPTSVPKISTISMAFPTVSRSAQKRFVSSAYWLNFSSFPNISIPLKCGSCRILLAIISAEKNKQIRGKWAPQMDSSSRSKPVGQKNRCLMPHSLC